MKAAEPSAVDGPQVLSIRDRFVDIYCAGMTTATPKEYLALPAGSAGNFSGAVRPEDCSFVCVPRVEIRTGYEKVRLDVATLKVDVTDRTFASTTRTGPAGEGPAAMNFGMASTGAVLTPADRGRGGIDLRGTPFAIESGFVVANSVFYPHYTSADASASISDSGQVATLLGGSLRASIRTADPNALQLKLLPETDPGTDATVVSADRVARAIFIAGEGIRLAQDASGLRALVQERLLHELYRQQPDLAADDAEAIIRAVNTVMTNDGPGTVTLATMAFNERILALLASAQLKVTSAGAFPGLDGKRATALAAALPRVADRALTESDLAAQPVAMFNATSDKSASLATGGFAAAKILSDTYELGRTNAAFRRARDELWAPKGAGMTADAPTLAAAYPALRSARLATMLRDLANRGSVKLSVVSALQAGADAAGKVTALMNEATAENKATDAACDQPTSDACTRALLQQAAGVRSRAVQFESARADGIVNAQLIFGIDPAIAAAQQAMTNASVDFSKATDAYVAAVKAEQARSKGLGIGKIVAGVIGLGVGAYTGNAGVVFGGITNIINGAGDLTASDPKGAAVQSQLKAISDQVTASTNLLDARLREVNTALQVQFRAIQTNTTQLATVLAKLDGQDIALQSIGAALGQVSTKIDTLSAQLVELFSATQNNQLVIDANEYTNRLRRTGEALSTSDLGKGTNALATAAISTASSPTVSSVPPASAYTRDETLAQLARPLDGNLNYLFRLPAERGWTAAPLMASAAPSPSYWSGAVRAYAQLLLENRTRLTQAYRNQLAAAQGVGQQLAGTLAKLSAADNPGGLTENKVLDGALADLQKVADAPAPGPGSTEQPSLRAAFDAEVSRYLSTLKSPGDQGLLGVDPFAATDSAATTTDFQFTSGNVIPSCEVAGKEIGMTPGTKALVPKLAIAAERLGLVKLSVCYKARFLGSAADRVGWYCYSICSTRYVEEMYGTTTSQFTEVGAQLNYSWEPRAGGSPTRFAVGVLSTDNYLISNEGRVDYAGFNVGCGKPFGQYGNVYDAMVSAFVTRQCLSLDNVIAHEATTFPGGPLAVPGGHWLGESADAVSSTQKPLDDLLNGPVEQLPLSPNPAQMTLPSLRQRVFDDLLRALDDASSPVSQAARRVEGARELVRTYVRLGFSQALASDDGLRSVVEGADLPLGSRDELKTRLQAARANPPASNRTASVPSVFGAFADGVVAGRKTFADAIKPHIGGADGLNPAGTVVGPTLERLTLTRAVLSAPATLGPAPGVTVPAAGATYTQGEAVQAAWACPAEMTCTAPVANGEHIDTASVGTKMFKVTATDGDGYSFSRTVEYTVAAPPPPPASTGGDTGAASDGTVSTGGTSRSGGTSGTADVTPQLPQKAPALSKLSLLKKSFPSKQGTKLRFTLDRAGTVTVTLKRLINKQRKAAGLKSLKGKAGTNSLAFGKGLKPGSYVATVVAVEGSRTSRPQTLRFTVRR